MCNLILFSRNGQFLAYPFTAALFIHIVIDFKGVTHAIINSKEFVSTSWFMSTDVVALLFEKSRYKTRAQERYRDVLRALSLEKRGFSKRYYLKNSV